MVSFYWTAKVELHRGYEGYGLFGARGSRPDSGKTLQYAHRAACSRTFKARDTEAAGPG